MKTLQSIITILFVCISSMAQSQQTKVYTVIKVSGNIHSTLLNRAIKTGDQIKPSDQLKFDNKSAYVHVVNNEGRKTIRNIPDSSPRDLMALLEKFQAHDTKFLKARGSVTKYIEALSAKLSHDTLLILGSGEIEIDTTKLSLKKPCGINAAYEMNDKRIEKTISREKSFTLSARDLFGDTAKPPYPKVQVYYLSDLTDSFFSSTIMFGIFTPYYADETILKQEVKTMMRAMRPAMSREEIEKEVFNYLSFEYATPMEDNMRKWLSGIESGEL